MNRKELVWLDVETTTQWVEMKQRHPVSRIADDDARISRKVIAIAVLMLFVFVAGCSCRGEDGNEYQRVVCQ